jgi:glycosyltransferase involved in cell wall biosynthesis
MKVLVITGDRRFGPGNERYELQKAAVESLSVVYWGRGSYWPAVPKGFDVVTVQDPFWRGVFGLIAAHRIGARLNVQVHTDLSAHSFVRHVLSQIVLRHADSIRVVSEKIKKQVEHIGVGAKISVLPVYIDISRFRAATSQSHRGKKILWVGRFEEEKNPKAAIDIFKEIQKSIPDATLTMLGTGSLAREIRTYGNGTAVQLPGWQDSLGYLLEADLVLSTSWHESFGASIIEALAAGVAVVAPDVGAAKEAGAVVVPREKLAAASIKALQEGVRGHLLLNMPTAEEWTKQWLETL